MRASPAVSVVMPACNVEPFVGDAIQSILDQRFEDFELIIRDDGSTDKTPAILCDWARRDSRIKLFRGDRLGLAGSSNWIVRQARSPFVARMDGDDIARPDRLERQLQLLKEDPSILLVGSLADTIDRNGRKVRGMDGSRLVRRSWFAPFPHTSAMFRREAFDTVGGYRHLPYCEDWDFFLRLSNIGRIVVIADALVSHRVVVTSFSSAPDHHEKVITGLDYMLAALPPAGSGQPYRPLALPAPCQTSPPPRVSPLAIISSSSALLWSGGSPRPVRELVQRGRLGLNAISIAALGWALLCQLSPGALRILLRGLALGRSLTLWHRVKRGKTYAWRPGGQDSI